MNSSNMLSRQGHRLLQVGVAFLLFSSLWGFAIPYVAAPHLGLSVHTLSAQESVLLLALGLVWPRLKFGAAASRIAFWCYVYSSVAILAAYVMGAVWGAGSETMRLAAQGAHGSPFQEHAIMIVAYSSAPTGLISFFLIFWGLRMKADNASQ